MTPHDGLDAPAEQGQEWFRNLFRDHHLAIRRYAVRRVGLQEADDVVAEVFTTAWRRRTEIPQDPLPWLYRAAHHHVLHARRSQARNIRLTARLHQHAGPPDAHRPDDLTAIDDAEAVLAVLAQLPQADAEILMLAGWEDLDTAAIAYVLGCSIAAARVRLHRARKRARALWPRPSPQGAPQPPRESPPTRDTSEARLTAARARQPELTKE